MNPLNPLPSRWPYRWKTMSLKHKLLLFAVLGGLLPIAVCSFIFYTLWTESVNIEIEDHYRNKLTHMQNRADAAFGELKTVTRSLAASDAASGLARPQTGETGRLPFASLLELAQALKRDLNAEYDISFIDTAKADVLTTTGKPYAYFQNMLGPGTLKADSPLLIPPHTYAGQDELLLLSPLPSADAAIALHVSSRELQNMSRRLAFEERQKLWLTAPDGKLLLSTDASITGNAQPAVPAPYEVWRHAPATLTQIVPFAGETYYVSAVTSDATGFTTVVMTPAAQFAAKTEYIPIVSSLFAIVMILIWLIVSYEGTMRLYGPVERLLDKYEIGGTYNPRHADEFQALGMFMAQVVRANGEMEDQLAKYMPDLKLSTFQHLLWGELTEAELQGKVEQLKLPLKGEYFYICVAVIDKYKQFTGSYNKNDQLIVHNTLRVMAIETFEDKMSCVTFTPRHGQVVILTGTDHPVETGNQLVRDLTDRYRAKVRSQFPFTLSVSISRPRRGYSSMSLSYHEASTMLNYKLLLGNDVTVSDHQLESLIRKSNRGMFQIQKQIVHAVIQGNLDDASRHLAELIETIPQQVYKSETALGIFSYLLGEIEYMIHEMELDVNEFFQNDLYDTLYSKSTLADVQVWLVDIVFPTIKEHLENQSVSRQKRIVQQVITYIHDLYDSDLTLQQVAEQLSVSASQLSRIFKEETDRNFSDYLIEYRMKKAVDLLQNTDMSIKDIAEKMRYTNVQNFTRIFKQITGMPPGEYRRQSRYLS
ncbi:helix-turn-helix domain-containing protein [Paenibacillus thalictri]|uniref:AraC family transcriptional regulator n=1 Tax=Paenibacillus thalictri TaxID=2527873 RepID=A0A4Q9DT99_9BACL|nr:helix-turn-helix domain-containing protein [Paenibacillus thalictri]TBL79496.1 AraC family transcriptional regulator [Paenibacillus thalictri]